MLLNFFLSPVSLFFLFLITGVSQPRIPKSRIKITLFSPKLRVLGKNDSGHDWPGIWTFLSREF